MAGPNNYLPNLPEIDPGAELLKGLQIGQAVRGMRQVDEDRALAKTTREAYAMDLQKAFANPTPEAFSQLVAKYPGQREALGDSWKVLSADQQQKEFTLGAQAYNAISAGKPEVAAKIVDDQIAAMKTAGKDTAKFDAIRAAIDTDPEGVRGHLGFTLSSLDPKRWSEMTVEHRKAQAAPAEQIKLEAESRVKLIEAAMAPQKIAADLGLSVAQAELAASGAAENRAKTRKIEGELSGLVPAEKRPELEGKLRKEYSDQTSSYKEIKQAYSRILASNDDAVGDLSLIFGYMKMLDPGSVVREGEFANAQNAAGVPDRVMNLYNRILKGERLNASQRSSFKGQAEKLYKSAGDGEKVVRDGILRIGKQYGLNPDNLFYEPTESKPTAQGGNPAPAGSAPAGPMLGADAAALDALVKKYAGQ